MVVNYNNGKIYKLVCNISGLIYIGSTTKEFLSQRLNKHRSTYKHWKTGKGNYVTSFKVLENDNFKIVLLEAVNCNSNHELKARERFYIESTDCVNKHIPNRTMKEWIEVNKESISEYQKEYKQAHKEKRDANRDEINKKAREKYAEKKVKYMERYPLLFPK
tara:strand:- start:105 stop:590 length:486 start_codon:yes stop_codon:yes gene_type:complete